MDTSKIAIGEVVKATATTYTGKMYGGGLIAGQLYKVVDMSHLRCTFGGHTTLFVRSVDRSIDRGIIPVRNAHLVLEVA
jgi:hypothetical protein